MEANGVKNALLLMYALSMIVLCFGCAASGSSPGQGSAVAGTAVSGFAMYARLNPSSVVAGMPVFLEITVQNTTSRSLKLYESYPELDFDVDVQGPSGDVKPRQAQHLKSAWKYMARDIPAGQAITYSYNLSKEYDVSTPGTYQVTASRRVLPVEGAGAADIAAPTVVLTVLPPPADSGQSMDEQTSELAKRIRLTIAAQQQSVVAGDRVTFNVSLKNISDKQVQIEYTQPFSMYNNDFNVQVRDAEKKEAHPTQFLMNLRTPKPEKGGGSPASIAIEPGQSVESAVNVARFYDMTMPGKYFVTLRTGSGPTLLVSNTVEVTIVETGTTYVIRGQKQDQK
jgi:hypothetical protein